MPDDRTTVTELATALGTLPFADAGAALVARPGQLRITDSTWDTLDAIRASGRFATEFKTAFANGRALLAAPDGLRDRMPLVIEWTGGRRPPGDEVAPIDLRIDHVYLISCKYESDILANASPARIFDGLLATAGSWDRSDWYEAVAPKEYEALYATCRAAVGLVDLPPTPSACSREQLQALRMALVGRSYPDPASRAAYADLCRTVSATSAARWSDRLSAAGTARETMLWRLLRIGSAPYFVLGNDRRSGQPARFRIAGPWDWREEFALHDFAVHAATAGQPRVDWQSTVKSRHDGHVSTVAGHVEIRWSHGRFAQPPEAKVYLDTPMVELPGYHPLGTADHPQLSLFTTG
jgi:hypothetical protein